MPVINGMILSSIATAQGYAINDWQFWAYVLFGGLYVISYEKLKNLK